MSTSEDSVKKAIKDVQIDKLLDYDINERTHFGTPLVSLKRKERNKPTEMLETWLDVNLKNINFNLKILKDHIGEGIGFNCVVKAGAYGLGAVRISETLIKAGVEYLSVTRPTEVFELRDAGIAAPILLLAPCSKTQIEYMINLGVTLSISSKKDAISIVSVSRNLKRKAKVHVNIDTGMGRLGMVVRSECCSVVDSTNVSDEKSSCYDSEDQDLTDSSSQKSANTVSEDSFQLPNVINLFKFLDKEPSVDVEGIFTHLSCADCDMDFIQEQESIFDSVLAKLKVEHLLPKWIHIYNSDGMFERGHLCKEKGYTMVRCGMALYGISSSSLSPKALELRNQLKKVPEAWKTRIIQIKELPARHPVNYGATYVTDKEETVGVIQVGYADGILMFPGEKKWDDEVIVRGKRAKVLGGINMDSLIIQLSDIPDAEVGDEVCIFGSQNGKEISLTELSDRWNDIEEDMITSMIGMRVYRLYLE